MDFTKQELARYARHFALPDFGMEGQKRLKNSSVLVVGAGGLGSPMLLYLAAAGVGRIGIVDPDVVDMSNLQRQILYNINDIGKPKAETAREKLLAMNPHIEIQAYFMPLNRENALDLVSQYDIVADGTDNFQTRYLVNDACVLAGKVNVYASIFRFEGQVSVFNLAKNGERGVNYRDLFPSPPPPGLVPDCAEGGVLGVLPGIIGSMQASEVIKILTGIGEPLAGRLFVFDAADFTTRVLKVSKNPNLVPITELIDYDMFCGFKPKNDTHTEGPLQGDKKEVSPDEFKKMQAQNIDFQLIDVREAYEYEVANLGGTLIPLSILSQKTDLISKEKQVIIHCKSGGRSAKAIAQLEQLGFTNLWNLTGGIDGFDINIDMKSLTFKQCTISLLEKAFGIEQVRYSDTLDQWLNYQIEITESERNNLLEQQDVLIFNILGWNEQELALNFIGPVVAMLRFKSKKFNLFAERPIEATLTTVDGSELTLNGRPDGIIASGFREPEVPFFSFHEHKQELDSSGDPAGQVLAAMLVGQAQNKNHDLPMYGCYIIGQNWYFLVLEGKNYTIASPFSATNNELFDIFRILKALKALVEKRMGV